MRASRDEMTTVMEAGDASVRVADWDGQRVVIMAVPAGTDFGPLLKGLPDDLCQCPHWRYVLKGRLRVEYGGITEILGAGDTFYLPPGHTGVVEEDFECVEVSPSDQHQHAMQTVLRNAAGAQASTAG